MLDSFGVEKRKLTQITVFLPTIFPGPEEVETKCPWNHIACLGANKCIHLSQLCNGILDCLDGYDEGVHCRGESICRKMQLKYWIFHSFIESSKRTYNLSCLSTPALSVIEKAWVLLPETFNMHFKAVTIVLYWKMLSEVKTHTHTHTNLDFEVGLLNNHVFPSKECFWAKDKWEVFVTVDWYHT